MGRQLHQKALFVNLATHLLAVTIGKYIWAASLEEMAGESCNLIASHVSVFAG
jgi:hypothetical protein